MNIQAFNNFCQTLPRTSHVVQWGGSHVWKVGGKVIAICGLTKEARLGFTFKCSDLSYQLLSEQDGCRPAPYFGAPWLQCYDQTVLDDASLKIYITASYQLIFAKLPKAARG